MDAILIRGARLIDPGTGVDAVRDLLAADGRVLAVADGIEPAAAEQMLPEPASLRMMDASGLWLMPGLVDLHVHFREPGFTHKETLATGARAAAAGGFTTVVCEPNTEPPIDSVELVRELAAKADREADVRVYFKAAMTRGRRGERPTAIRALAAEERVVALSDDGDPLVRPDVMEQVCALAAEAGIPLAPHSADSAASLEKIEAGVDPGFRPDEPFRNEANWIERDLRIAGRFGCRIHFSHVSLARSMALIAGSQPRLSVSCEATPHHLLLCREDFGDGEVPRVNPPIRSAADRGALRRALISGEVDVIASDHAPHTVQDKAAGACGLIGLETTLGLVLTHLLGEDGLSPLEAVRLMSTSPARLFGLPGGSLAAGSPADMVLVDPEREWTVDPEQFRSRSRNTPYAGWKLRGKVAATFVAGEQVYAAPAFE